MKELEGLLGRLEDAATRSGHGELSRNLFEVRVSTAVAIEMMAAVDRGDFLTAEMLSEVLDRQMAEARPVWFENGH